MSLQEKITAELKSAMMAKNADRTAALRLIKSAVGYTQIEKKTDQLSDADVQSVLEREAKKRRDAIEQYERGGRPELAAKERAELAVIEEFLPRALTPEQLETLARNVISEIGATSKRDMGAIIKAVQAKLPARADGKILSAIVARLLP